MIPANLETTPVRVWICCSFWKYDSIAHRVHKWNLAEQYDHGKSSFSIVSRNGIANMGYSDVHVRACSAQMIAEWTQNEETYCVEREKIKCTRIFMKKMISRKGVHALQFMGVSKAVDTHIFCPAVLYASQWGNIDKLITLSRKQMAKRTDKGHIQSEEYALSPFVPTWDLIIKHGILITLAQYNHGILLWRCNHPWQTCDRVICYMYASLFWAML